MCLITLNTAETRFTKAWLTDFFNHNSDGLGVMYAENGELIVEKFVPKNVKQALKFYATHIEGKDAIVHWRMRTHGDIDTANSHPYEVLNKKDHGIDLWMMHNGILHDVNDDQQEMSDTWHFIRDTIRPILSEYPALLHHQAFIELLEERIGESNKLAFMDNLGNRTIVNEHAFVEFNGAKLSNTYAWSSWSKHNLDGPEPYPAYKLYKTYSYGKSPQDYWHNDTDEDEFLPKASHESCDLLDMVYNYPDEVALLLEDYAVCASDVQRYVDDFNDFGTEDAA
jgi:hypothetical protein